MLSNFQPRTLGLSLTLIAAMSLPAAAAVTKVVPLDNLFDDGAATPIATAIGTDTYGAAADTSDLGVVTVIDSAHTQAMNVAVTIAPGVSFDYTNVGGGTVNPRVVRNDQWGDPEPIRTTGTSSGYTTGSKIEDGIGMHASALISFDLNALRTAGLADFASLFTAYYDQNDDQAANGSHRASVVVSDASGNVLAGYLNGQKQAVVNTSGTWSFTGTIPSEHTGGAASGINFNVGLPTNAAYLTLAVTSTDVTSDHAAWSAPQINAAPVIQLGNLFDDANTVSLWDALATDTYKASAGTGDLGVDTLQAGGLDVAQSVNTAGVQFDFNSAGGGSTSSDGLVNDSIGVGGTSRPPLRLSGSGAGFPASDDWDDTKVKDGIGIHANRLVTFDLDEIRAAGDLGDAAFRFTAKAGLNDSSIVNDNSDGIRTAVLLSDDTGVVAGYVNGQLVDITDTAGVWSFTGTIPAKLTSSDSFRFYDMIIDADIQYLTLAGLGAGNITSDHIAFVDANLTTYTIPAPAALPTGLILMGAMALRRRVD